MKTALLKEESIINHSLLSPLLNSGLINPIYTTLHIRFYKKNNIRLNSCEGLIRQIIGWREFIRGVYISKGVEETNQKLLEFSKIYSKIIL